MNFYIELGVKNKQIETSARLANRLESSRVDRKVSSLSQALPFLNTLKSGLELLKSLETFSCHRASQSVNERH